MAEQRKINELNDKEKARLQKYNDMKEELVQKGLKPHPLTVSATKANVYAVFIMMPIIALFVLLYFILGNKFDKEIIDSSLLIIVIANFFVSTVIHELIHGCTWGLLSKNKFKDIEFGVIWSALTPYCSCTTPLKKYKYVLGSSMPGLLLGVVPIVISLFTNSTILLLSGCFQLWCAGGDFYVLSMIALNKPKSKNAIYYDHPTEPGVVFFE